MAHGTGKEAGMSSANLGGKPLVAPVGAGKTKPVHGFLPPTRRLPHAVLIRI
jgi:hypothetical protein